MVIVVCFPNRHLVPSKIPPQIPPLSLAMTTAASSRSIFRQIILPMRPQLQPFHSMKPTLASTAWNLLNLLFHQTGCTTYLNVLKLINAMCLQSLIHLVTELPFMTVILICIWKGKNSLQEMEILTIMTVVSFAPEMFAEMTQQFGSPKTT
jgi:hypothetical protein